MHMNIATLKPSEADPTHPRLDLSHMGRTLTQSPRYENGISARRDFSKNFWGEIPGKSSAQGAKFIRRSRSALGCLDSSFSVRFDKGVDVLLAAATEHKQLAFR